MVDFEKLIKDELSANFVSTDGLITEEGVFALASEFKQVKKIITSTNNKQKHLKGLIIAGLKGLDAKAIKNTEHEISVQYPKSFDQGICGFDHPELCAKYTTTEFVTTEVKKFDKNLFKKHHPELYEEYSVELTARLTVK